ncbi:unnamed protein product, partial [marine sediment metagenome]
FSLSSPAKKEGKTGGMDRRAKKQSKNHEERGVAETPTDGKNEKSA